MLGMEVPVRAIWARTLMAELNRVLNHLMFLGSYPLEVGAITPIFYAFREREAIQQVMEEISGGRMHYMFNRVGGLKEDLPAGWLSRSLPRFPAYGPVFRRCVTWCWATRSFRLGPVASGSCRPRRFTPTGSLARSPEPAVSTSTCAATSPTWHTRSCSDPVGGAGVTRNEGDCYARFSVLSEQVSVSLDMADACVDQLHSLPPDRSTCGSPKCSRSRKDTPTAGPRTRWGSTATTWSRAGEDTVAAQASVGVVQQHRCAARAAGRMPHRRHGRDPGVDVLCGGRHRQVARLVFTSL